MITVGVYRIFGGELEKPIHDPEVALQFHNMRKEALHDVFDNQDNVSIQNWGETDDTQPHEFVSLAIATIGTTALTNYVLIPAIKFIFERIADKAIDTAMEKSVGWILTKLKKKQQEKKIGDCQINLPNGVVLYLDKPAQGNKIRYTVDGKWEQIEFISSE